MQLISLARLEATGGHVTTVFNTRGNNVELETRGNVETRLNVENTWNKKQENNIPT